MDDDHQNGGAPSRDRQIMLAEETLRASELRYRRLFEAAKDGILILDVGTGRITDVNSFLVKLLGFSHGEMIGKTVGELSPFKDVMSNLAMLGQLQKDGYVRYENLPLETKDGRKIAVEFVSNVYQAGDKMVIQCNIRDITERKRVEESLRVSEERYHSLFENMLDGLAYCRMVFEQGRPHDFIYLEVNNAFEKVTGLKNVVGKSVTEVIPGIKESNPEIFEIYGRVALTGQAERFEIYLGRLKAWLAISVYSTKRECFVAVFKNVTERKRTEARFRRLVDSNAQGVIFWNTKGLITEANDSFLRLVGHTRADLDAGPIDWVAMTPPKYAALDQRALKELAATGICTPFEKEYIRKDGSRVPILIGAATFEDNPDEGVCFVLDLTERKKLEQQFRQTQKMDGIGQLAGGVAHDFNNILAVVQMQAELLKSSIGLSEEQSEIADEISATVKRAATLTRQLLLFSRREMFQPRDLDLSESITSTVKMLQRILGENIQIQLKLAPQPMHIHADAGMMDQVLLNLVVNARDAMPDGGDLVIETSGVEFDEFAASQSAQVRVGSFVCLNVSDSGGGIPLDILPKIFEPFFTTKDVGKGTGLGLATVYGIVQQHQGWINVYSEVGHGTTFRIYLPRLAKGTDPKPAQPASMAIRGGNETILLVEDDPSLRISVRMALSRLGYRILEAPTGVKALEVWKENRDEIRLLLTDLVMPDGMTGKKLAQIVLLENPKLKVIYMSGYSAEVVGRDFPLKEGVNFLTKPFQGLKLAQTIRDSLDLQM
ncbi:MAG TPA: PAS domain S-box protein [Verrucomicrobiae bacterium]|nr:PAS domain S-box protein [Verrucomicrobiae bacterium]